MRKLLPWRGDKDYVKYCDNWDRWFNAKEDDPWKEHWLEELKLRWAGTFWDRSDTERKKYHIVYKHKPNCSVEEQDIIIDMIGLLRKLGSLPVPHIVSLLQCTYTTCKAWLVQGVKEGIFEVGYDVRESLKSSKRKKTKVFQLTQSFLDRRR